MGQVTDELTGDILGFAQGTFCLVGKAEPCFDLPYKLMIEALYVDSRMVCDGAVADTRMPKVAGEEDGTTKADDFVQLGE